ncbi:MAG: hypothetical protein JGK21_01235 [Microcoleus sp. PH2017_22_RUC_O_B]|uniref:hypothetical protein n=1 Tax=unclassified Microcoleus TaxID=2642155 RepID=UPI001DE0F4BB|nr:MULTISPECIES: hypothetical protein [unclassified Microcoleus]MCC3526788.1 hypothetical protein [Microcoleus sp. PH2017_21_RUC_O_A]MCC3539021.1 hypothetical protein [Microcoleus sp. PH2017_22_RUC_O_B]
MPCPLPITHYQTYLTRERDSASAIALALNDLSFYAAISYGLCCEKVNSLVQDIQAKLLLLALLAAVLSTCYFLGFALPVDLLLHKYC